MLINNSRAVQARQFGNLQRMPEETLRIMQVETERELAGIQEHLRQDARKRNGLAAIETEIKRRFG